MNARMLRPLPALALLALLAELAPASEVSTDDAARAAKAWVDRGYAMGKLPVGRTVSAVDEVEDPATGARLLVAKFEGGGFVVLSADDLVDPVLAFSETGDGIDRDENNPFWALLRGDIAAREAAAGVVRGADPVPAAGSPQAAPAAPTAAQRKWAALLGAEDATDDNGARRHEETAASGVETISDIRVDSFVESRWNQKTYSNYSGDKNCYNYYTPNNYYCGCVATAIGQIMRYWQYPRTAVTANSYPCAVDGSAVTKTMMGGVYDWSKMPLKPYLSVPSDEECQAIGKLIYDVGVTVEMNWKSSGSSASIYSGVACLPIDYTPKWSSPPTRRRRRPSTSTWSRATTRPRRLPHRHRRTAPRPTPCHPDPTARRPTTASTLPTPSAYRQRRPHAASRHGSTRSTTMPRLWS